MRRIVLAGNILTEYGLLIGLVALASVASLKLLGVSTTNLLNGVSDKPQVMKMMSMEFSSDDAAGKQALAKTPVSLTGAGYYTQVRNRRTGKTEFKLTTDSNSGVTNATSIDGAQWNSLGQFQIADTLWQMAEKQTDPVAKEFILNLAKSSYYMGAAEGEIDAVAALQLHDSADSNFQYGKINGYADILRLQQDIMSTLNNPPAGLDRQTLQQVSALSLDVYNIGQSYVDALGPVNLDSPYSFVLPADFTTGAGNGTPGQALSTTEGQVSYCGDNLCGQPQSQGGPTVEQVFTVDELRVISKDVLSTFGVAPEPVVATLTDATHLDRKSSYRRR